jgi:hypothetical protein
VSTNSCISDYVDTMIPADSIDGFESDDDIFDQIDNNEHHILSNENITSYQRPETIVESSATHEPTLQANIASMNYQMPMNAICYHRIIKCNYFHTLKLLNNSKKYIKSRNSVFHY